MNTTANKTLTILEQCKSIAIALVGAGMAGKGITYFSPRLSYDVPRILLPVFKILGNTGLAVSMLLLGLVLLTWSYFRWKKNNGKQVQWALIAGLLSVIIITGVYILGNKQTGITTATDLLPEQQTQVNESGDDPATEVSFPSSFSAESKQQYEQLIKELEAAIQSKDNSKIWASYNKLNVFTARLNPDQNDPEQLNFIVAQSRKMDGYLKRIKK
jgi:hypothetical protein